MDQHTIWRTEGIVLESVQIGQYSSKLQHTVMVKQMQWQAMYPNGDCIEISDNIPMRNI